MEIGKKHSLHVPGTLRHAAAHPSTVAGMKSVSGLAPGISPPGQFWWLQLNFVDSEVTLIAIVIQIVFKNAIYPREVPAFLVLVFRAN